MVEDTRVLVGGEKVIDEGVLKPTGGFFPV